MMKKIIMMLIVGTSIPALAMKSEESLNNQLWKAVYADQNDKVLELLSRGANVNARDQYQKGTTPLYRAVHEQNLELCKILIDAHADPNAQDYQGYTPLMIAVTHTNDKIVKLLLDAGASPSIINKYGENALVSLLNYPKSATSEQRLVPYLNLLLFYIPPQEQTRIQNAYHALIAMKKMQHPRLYRDIRNMLIETIINQLVEEQMTKIRNLLMQPSVNHGSALDLLKERKWRDVAPLFDITNPESYARIRKQVENNIRKIIAQEARETRSQDTRSYKDIDELLGTFDQPK